MLTSAWTLPPNLLSLGRLLATPAVFALVLASSPVTDLAALLLFVVAAASDYVDGWLARRRGWVTEVGIYLDPLADKLLLVSVLVPFYLVTADPASARGIPYWGSLPLWALAILLGREVVVSGLALAARRRGATVPAEAFGKWKSAVEDLFSAALLLWWTLRGVVWPGGRPSEAWEAWAQVHAALVGLSLAAAVGLAAVSVVAYVRHARGRVAEADG